MMRQWKLSDLFVDHGTGRLRESKVWSNIAKGSMTFGFLWAVVHGQNTDWLWTAFGTPLLGHELVGRWLNQKEPGNVTPKPAA